MITPKEKAEQLISNFSPFVYCYLGSGMLTNTEDDEVIKMNAKKCALIAVEEMLKSEPRSPSNVDWDDVGGTHQYYYEAQREEANKFWQEVKQELEKL
jgi:hypothetical protein